MPISTTATRLEVHEGASNSLPLSLSLSLSLSPSPSLSVSPSLSLPLRLSKFAFVVAVFIGKTVINAHASNTGAERRMGCVNSARREVRMPPH
jgi:hypothetical protein